MSKKKKLTDKHYLSIKSKPAGEYLVCDASCLGNPGKFEFRVMNEKKEILFASTLFKNGTNNIGEFLAIVSAFEYRTKHKLSCPVFSDSTVAIGWANLKKCKTKQVGTDLETQKAIYLAANFLSLISTQPYLFFWNNKEWGENPADYNRK